MGSGRNIHVHCTIMGSGYTILHIFEINRSTVFIYIILGVQSPFSSFALNILMRETEKNDFDKVRDEKTQIDIYI